MPDTVMLPEAMSLAERKKQMIAGLERVILEIDHADNLGEFSLSIKNEVNNLPGVLEICSGHAITTGCWQTVELDLSLYKEPNNDLQ